MVNSIKPAEESHPHQLQSSLFFFCCYQVSSPKPSISLSYVFTSSQVLKGQVLPMQEYSPCKAWERGILPLRKIILILGQ